MTSWVKLRPFKHQLSDLLAGDGERYLGGLGLHRAEFAAADVDLGAHRADRELGVDAFGAGHAQHDAVGLELLKSRRRDLQAIRPASRAGTEYSPALLVVTLKAVPCPV